MECKCNELFTWNGAQDSFAAYIAYRKFYLF